MEHFSPNRDFSLPSESLYTPFTDSTYTFTPTSDLPMTPEDAVSKRSEVIEEFWMKSAEIRKSLGLTALPRDLKDMDGGSTSSDGDTFYTSDIHTASLYTSSSDSPSHTSHKCDSNSGTHTRGTCTRSTQTPSQTENESMHTHSSSGRSHTSEAEEAEAVLGEVVGRCSAVHRLNITLEGHVTKEERGLISHAATNSTETDYRVSESASDLLTPPCSPPVVCRNPIAVRPALEREVLLSSGSHPDLLKKNMLQSGLGRAQSLPPDELGICFADEAGHAASNQLPPRASLMDHNTPNSPGPSAARKDRSRRTLSEGPLQVGGAEVWLRRPEVKGGAEEKEKKRSSLFSPRKSKKSGETQQESVKHKSLWKSVFSGYKKEKKRKETAALAGTLPASAEVESRKRVSGLSRTTGEQRCTASLMRSTSYPSPLVYYCPVVFSTL